MSTDLTLDQVLSEIEANQEKDLKWRRERDSNSRAVLPAAPLARECLRPLGHLSGNGLLLDLEIYNRVLHEVKVVLNYTKRNCEHDENKAPPSSLVS